MLNLWNLGGLSLKELLWPTARESWEDEVFGQAARLAFYHLLGLFPALLLAVLVLARLEHTGSGLLETLQSSLQRVFPDGVAQMVIGFLDDVRGRTVNGEIGFAILGSLWSAFNGTWAVMSSLNDAYEVEDQRSLWKTTIIAAGLTLALAVLSFIALLGLLYGKELDAAAGLGMTWRIIHWFVVAGLLLVAFALFYRFGPDLHGQKMRWTTPGAVVGVVLWLTASLLLRAYVQHAKSKYDLAYGSVANVVILLLWFYVTGVAILIGGEVNSEIENAAAQNGHPDARRPGERRPGGRSPQRLRDPSNVSHFSSGQPVSK